jgi:thiamine-monophosphate kinase
VTVAEIGERELVVRIRRRLEASAPGSQGLVIGIGDDAAVVAPARNRQAVLTTDAQVDGVHFDRAFSSPAEIGARAVVVNVSDLAAMGATPKWLLLSLVLPPTVTVADVEALAGGVAEAAARYGATVIGGNVTSTSGPLVVDVTAVGDVAPRRVLTRSGGQPGDGLYVSGTIGGAAAGLEMLRDGTSGSGDTGQATCIARYRTPAARVRLGRAMGQAKAARAAMDLSDGLADAAAQMAEASGCGVEIDGGALPIEPGAHAWWAARQRDVVDAALRGGDDYELLFAVPRSGMGRLRHVMRRVATPTLTRVGQLTKDRGHVVRRNDGRRERLPQGFAHWRAKD